MAKGDEGFLLNLTLCKKNKHLFLMLFNKAICFHLQQDISPMMFGQAQK